MVGGGLLAILSTENPRLAKKSFVSGPPPKSSEDKKYPLAYLFAKATVFVKRKVYRINIEKWTT
jgi:hypothetical protein